MPRLNGHQDTDGRQSGGSAGGSVGGSAREDRIYRDRFSTQ